MPGTAAWIAEKLTEMQIDAYVPAECIPHSRRMPQDRSPNHHREIDRISSAAMLDLSRTRRKQQCPRGRCFR